MYPHINSSTSGSILPGLKGKQNEQGTKNPFEINSTQKHLFRDGSSIPVCSDHHRQTNKNHSVFLLSLLVLHLTSVRHRKHPCPPAFRSLVNTGGPVWVYSRTTSARQARGSENTSRFQPMAEVSRSSRSRQCTALLRVHSLTDDG